MKFFSTKELLEYALNIAERFTGKNINLPILSNVLIEANNNNLMISAVNLEYAVEVFIPGKSTKNGKVSVPAKILNQLIQSIREEKIDLEEKNGNLLVRTDTREVKINGLSSDDFPLVPRIKKSFSFSCDSLSFSEAIGKVLPAVSTSEFKPELNGVFISVHPNNLVVAATDTFRLAEKKLKLQEKIEADNFSFILPWKFSQEVMRIFGAEDKKLKISGGENQIIFETDNIKAVSRLVEGSFPEYGGIIPGGFKTSSFMQRTDLVDAIRSSSIFSSKLQDVTLDFKGKEVVVASLNQEVGENRVTIPISMTGSPLKISFNYRFLLDGLNVLDEDEIFFGCNEDNTPVLMRNKSNDTFLYVVMPIRVS